MKNKLICAWMLTAGLAASGAQAQQSYVGASVGETDQKLRVSGVGSLDDQDTAFKLVTGYRYDQHFGIEAGYVHHGEGEIGAAGLRVTSRPRSLYLAATATLPLPNQFSLFGKLGASYNRTKFNATGSPEEKENKTTLLIGIGAAYAFTPAISGVVEYEHFGKLADEDGVDLKARTWTIGVRATF
jgi:OOP family OmpA-OmpF porin